LGVGWIIVVVVAVVLLAVLLVSRSRKAEGPPASEAPVGEAAGDEAKERAEVPEPGAEVVERAAEAEAPVEAVVPERAAKAEPTAKELRSRVEERLAESERMLGELRKATEHDEAVAHRVGAGTVEIVEEGLQEVRSLAERKKWSQAKDKGEALHAQLSLMLQSARREKAS
jgi:ElaB/YqjD/DUF883 family membrane-anchored ribosome-binding protein